MGTLVEHQHPICHLDHRQSHPHDDLFGIGRDRQIGFLSLFVRLKVWVAKGDK